MITVATLFSGSSGNSTLIRTENTAILVDAGKNRKAIISALSAFGMTLSDISAIFITHEHADHVSALDVIAKNSDIPIYITSPSAKYLTASARKNAVVSDKLIFSEKTGDISVKSFPLPHDSAAHVGYVFTSDDGDKAGVATDMGFATMEAFNNLRGSRQAVIEANHDIEMLKTGAYPYYLKQRILSKTGHLSNAESAGFCLGLCAEGCEKLMLAHLSRENNTPDAARSTVFNTLSERGFGNTVLKIAPPDTVTEL